MFPQGAPIALRMAKAAINRGMDVDLQTGYALEHSFYAQASHLLSSIMATSSLCCIPFHCGHALRSSETPAGSIAWSVWEALYDLPDVIVLQRQIPCVTTSYPRQLQPQLVQVIRGLEGPATQAQMAWNRHS